MTTTNQSGTLLPVPTFLRLPSGPDRQLWPGINFTYWDLQRLISPGPWNNETPLVRAYDLRKPGATRGIPLIEHASLLDWFTSEFKKNNPSFVPDPVTITPPPTFLTLPSSGNECPYTQLRSTVMHELAQQLKSPYGLTNIYVSRFLIPGRKKSGRKALERDSLFRFIRSFPPPKYQIPPPKFPGSNPSTPL